MTADPRELVVFLFACLFKPTVSSRRQKILQNDLWPQKVQTFESMIEQYVRTCSDVLCASLAFTTPGEAVDVAGLHLDAAGVRALSLLFFDSPESGASHGVDVKNSSKDAKGSENVRGATSVDMTAPVLELSAQLCATVRCAVPGPERREVLGKDTLELAGVTKDAVVYHFATPEAGRRPRDVRIVNCAQAVIYLLGPVGSVTVSACRGVRLVVPTVGGVLAIQNSKGLSVSSCARFLKIFHSDDLGLNVSCVESLCQDCQAQTLQAAPFNYVWTDLDRDLAGLGLSALLDGFESYLVRGPLGVTGEDQRVPLSSDFLTQVVPYGASQGVAFRVRLPEHFAELLRARTDRLREF